MPEKKFELGDYVEVKDRIRIFYELFGQGRLVTDEVTLTTEPDGKPRVMVRAHAYRTADDPHPGVGYSWLELPGSTPYTRGSELENAETSAWGRAIASLGILIDKSIASGQEVQNKQTNGKATRSSMIPDGPDAAIQRAAQGAAETRTTHHDGLIGKAIAQGTQDFQLRQGPDGPALPFRIKEGRLSQIAVATGAIATALDTFRDDVLGQRVTVWGHYTDEHYDKRNKATDLIETITYKVLHVERIKTPAFEMPAPGPAQPTEEQMVRAAADEDGAAEVARELAEAESAPLPWDPAESDRLDAEEAAASV